MCGKKWLHNTTSDNPIFINIQWIWNSTFRLGVEKISKKKYRQYDKIWNTSYQKQVVKCHILLITHSWWTHVFRSTSIILGLLDVWKHDWTFRILGQWFRMWRPNSPVFLSPNVRWSYVHPFYSNGLFLYLLKTPESLWFSDVFRGYRNVTLDKNGFMNSNRKP